MNIVVILLIVVVLALLYLLRKKRKLNKSLAEKIDIENALKHIYTSNKEKTPATFNSIKGQTELSEKKVLSLINKLLERDLISRKVNEFFLTSHGNKYALNIIRSHRLWEKFLAEESGVSSDRWHEEAEIKEHFMSDAEREELVKKLGHPLRDPHGDPIPDEEGNYFELSGTLLLEIRKLGKYKIIHVEDEPKEIYQQILDIGLYPNMVIEIEEITDSAFLILTDEGPKKIPKELTGNLTVKEVEEEVSKDVLRLTDIPLGEKAKVVKLSEKLIGPNRRRLLDLGVIPSTEITVRFRNVSGNPRAYEIKNTLIALRDDVAELIYVRKIESE